MSIQTGYFGRPKEKGQSGKFTKVHIVSDGKPVCGYKPHPTMRFQFCANGVERSYVECKKCKEMARRF